MKKSVGALVNIIKTFTNRQLRITENRKKKENKILEIAYEEDNKRKRNLTHVELIPSF